MPTRVGLVDVGNRRPDDRRRVVAAQVGRTTERAVLHGQLRDAARGRGGAALITGGAGSGKSK